METEIVGTYVLLVKYFKRIHQEILTIKLSPSLPVVAQLGLSIFLLKN